MSLLRDEKNAQTQPNHIHQTLRATKESLILI